MYVTRPRSHYLKFPSSLSLPPPEGPNSGYLVIHDEESVATCCFGLCNAYGIDEIPFPQDKLLQIQSGDDNIDVYLIPVLNQPLSSNLYYIIKAEDRQRISLTTEDLYRKIEITTRETRWSSGYVAKSLVQDGFLPSYISGNIWMVSARSSPGNYQLSFEAQGVKTSLRARLPQFDFSLSSKSSETVDVGKWYTPSVFIKEEGRLKNSLLERPMFYEVTLKQQWKQIYECEKNINGDHNYVVVDVSLEREVALLFGKEALHNHTNVTEGVIWFSTSNGAAAAAAARGGESRVGLSSEVAERMRWEQERVGWVGRREKLVRVERVDEFQGEKHEWKKYGCYILVERFEFKRMDGSLLLTYEFRHAHEIRSKWE